MKTKLLFLAAIAALTIVGCSKERGGETPDPPTPPPTPEEELYDIYLAGSIFNGTTFPPCYWKNGERHDLPFPDGKPFYVETIAYHDGKLYVTAQNPNGIFNGYIIDGVWHANEMPDGVECIYSSFSIDFLDGSVYMAGYYITEARKFIGCYWKDGVCHPLDIPNLRYIDSSAASVAVYDGSVYIAGNGEGNEIAGYWKDEVWNPLTIPDGFSIAHLQDIACSDGSVYVTGYLGYRQACLWVDGVAQILSAPGGLTCYGGKIAVADGKVYVAGYYLDNDNYAHACYWQDGVFHKLDAPGIESRAKDIKVVDGSVFIAGEHYAVFDMPSGCYWKDGVRVDIPTPEGMKSYVNGMAVAKKQ